MARSNRHGATRVTPRANRHSTCVWWFLLGAMLGSFGVGLYWMLEAPPGQVPPAVAAIPKVERPAPERPDFRFPDLLKHEEVEVREERELPPPAPRPEPPRPVEPATEQERDQVPPPPAPATPGSYLLQLASFKSASDAENMKAKLAMGGVTSRVQSATIRNGQVWYRVLTGPYPSKQAMESARAELARNGKESIPIKVQ